MGALISHCVIEVIYHFDFKKLFAHWPQLILAAALSMALFFSFRFDWWGYDSYLPEAENVEKRFGFHGYGSELAVEPENRDG